MDGSFNGWMDPWRGQQKKQKKIASCETFCRLSNHNIVRTFTLSKMNVRKSAIRAMNRCLSVAIPLGAILLLASAQGGTFHRPVRAILFQFHLLLPRPTGGRSSRLDSSSEVLPSFSRQTRVRLEKMEPGRVLRFLYPIPHTVRCLRRSCLP